ncbi:2-phosphosulfolactate phosphatase [candidate division FCPU426 bacterium]|nr:2-phosphosulfolactate phosphatase [candidate division FCPU426 bacterium]
MQIPDIRFLPHPHAARLGIHTLSTVIVIDVLRATTSMLAALRAGCKRVVPCATIRTAKQQAAEWRRKGDKIILAGERGGYPIPGFDCGNSPREFRKSKNKTVILTTSNGTRALLAASHARKVMIACLNNLTAVGRQVVRQKEKRIVILGAGEKGGEALEDTFTAGKLIRFIKSIQPTLHLDAGAQRALNIAETENKDTEAYLCATPHGKALLSMGFAQDIHDAARLDTTRLLGCLSSSGIVAGA